MGISQLFQILLLITCLPNGLLGISYEEYIKCLMTPGCVHDKPKRTSPLLECLKSANCGAGGGGVSRETPIHTKPATGDDCVMPNGSPGTCVQKYLCGMNESGVGEFQTIELRSIGGPCESHLDTCCPKDSMKRGDQQSCGKRNVDGVGFRILNGNYSQFGEFPWMVEILKEDTFFGEEFPLKVYLCGGSLIHPRVVLTTGHCVVGTRGLWIRAGEWNTQTTAEFLPHQDRRVAEIVLHEEYTDGMSFNIALLILQEPVDENLHIGTVCLASQRQELSVTNCLVSGWGKDIFAKEMKYQDIMKKVELNLVERAQCERALRTTRLGPKFSLHESYICAGGEKAKDTCKGDGGSPLVCPMKNDPEVYAQTGIVAWGVGCGTDGVPGVYTDVGHLNAWIRAKMAMFEL